MANGDDDRGQVCGDEAATQKGPETDHKYSCWANASSCIFILSFANTQSQQATSAGPSAMTSTYPSAISSALPSVNGTPIGTTSAGSLSPPPEDEDATQDEDEADADGEEDLDFGEASGSGSGNRVETSVASPEAPRPLTGGKGLYKYPAPPVHAEAADHEPDLYGQRRSVRIRYPPSGPR